MMMSEIVLWVYIALLLAGGLMGYFKANSKVSLITSTVFAGVLLLCATGVIVWPYLPDIILILLVVVFGIRLAKTKKFMPSGLMLGLSILALILRHV